MHPVTISILNLHVMKALKETTPEEDEKAKTDILNAYADIVHEILFTPELLPLEQQVTPTSELLESAKQFVFDAHVNVCHVTIAELDVIEARIKEEYVLSQITWGTQLRKTLAGDDS